MKIKFVAAIALAIWLAVTGWLATMVVVKPAVLQLGNDADETAAMVELRTAIARNKQMQAQVERLRQSVSIGEGQPLLALPLATPPAGEGGPSSALAGEAGAEAATHNVSLVLVTDGRPSAVVDGQRVQRGSRLAGGARVVAIGPDWVRISNAAGEQTTLPVPSPFTSAAGARR
jgi:hypothetical protein